MAPRDEERRASDDEECEREAELAAGERFMGDVHGRGLALELALQEIE